MADRGHRRVVLHRAHLHRTPSARKGELLDELRGFDVRAVRRHDDPGTFAEEIGRARRVTRLLAAGHRMAADESQPVPPGALDDRHLRARDVRHHGVAPEYRREVACQPVHELEADQRRTGQDDQVGIGDRRGGMGRRLVKHAFVDCRQRSVAAG